MLINKAGAALAAVLLAVLAAGCGTAPNQARKELRGRYEALWRVAQQEAVKSCRESNYAPMLSEEQKRTCEASMTKADDEVLKAKQEGAESTGGG
jgi:hypothetical protein